LKSEKQVDNQVSMPPDLTQTSTPSSSTPPPQNSKETEVDKLAKQVH